MKNVSPDHILTLNILPPDRPMPEAWRKVAIEVLRTKVHPVLQTLAENQSTTVATNRTKSPQIAVKGLPAKSSPWVARVVLNAETVMYVARRAVRLMHGGEAYHATI